ncbi:hypothetical protein XENOCAPTIV_003604 [Xenoophorus captivus]|uniref:Uncharacterized protein n=1 Tax=Xenoophorus captivus TaxID=1517983 RepID=A0ABV0S4Y5_9TELE
MQARRSGGQRKHPEGWHENSHFSLPRTHRLTNRHADAGVCASSAQSQRKQTDWLFLTGCTHTYSYTAVQLCFTLINAAAKTMTFKENGKCDV